MGDVEQLRFAQLLKRVFGTRAVNPGRILTPAVSPTTEVQDFYQPENRASRGEGLWGAVLASLSNTVASFSTMSLSNPANSNKVTVLKKVTVSMLVPTATVQPASMAFMLSVPQTPSQGGVVVNSRDSRRSSLFQIGPPLSTTYITSTQGVNTLDTFAAVSVWGFLIPTVATNSTLYVHRDEVDYVLLPNTNVNIGIRLSTLPTATWTYMVAVEGYERTIDLNELNPVA